MIQAKVTQPKLGTTADNGCEDGTGNTSAKYMKHYINDCPFRIMQVASPCDYVPTNFICNNPGCWSLGETMKGVDWTKLKEKDLKKFTQAITLVQPEIMNRLVDAYLAEQKHPQL